MWRCALLRRGGRGGAAVCLVLLPAVCRDEIVRANLPQFRWDARLLLWLVSKGLPEGVKSFVGAIAFLAFVTMAGRLDAGGRACARFHAFGRCALPDDAALACGRGGGARRQVPSERGDVRFTGLTENCYNTSQSQNVLA